MWPKKLVRHTREYIDRKDSNAIFAYLYQFSASSYVQFALAWQHIIFVNNNK